MLLSKSYLIIHHHSQKNHISFYTEKVEAIRQEIFFLIPYLQITENESGISPQLFLLQKRTCLLYLKQIIPSALWISVSSCFPHLLLTHQLIAVWLCFQPLSHRALTKITEELLLYFSVLIFLTLRTST